MVELNDYLKDSSAAIFKPEDFKSLALEVSLHNSAHPLEARKKLPKGKAEAPRPDFELLEIESDSLALDIPERFCSLGHHLLLVLKVGAQLEFSATASVISVEFAGNRRNRIRISLLQYDKKTWSEVQRVFLGRQNEIIKFLKDAKGY